MGQMELTRDVCSFILITPCYKLVTSTVYGFSVGCLGDFLIKTLITVVDSSELEILTTKERADIYST